MKGISVTALTVLGLALWVGQGCATVHGHGSARGRLYTVRVASVNGYPTANRGSVAFPACTLQFGDHVAQV